MSTMRSSRQTTDSKGETIYKIQEIKFAVEDVELGVNFEGKKRHRTMHRLATDDSFGRLIPKEEHTNAKESERKTSIASSIATLAFIDNGKILYFIFK